MPKQYIIVFYTVEPKPPEIYRAEFDMTLLFNRIIELTKHRAKFTIYEMGKCVGDYS